MKTTISLFVLGILLSAVNQTVAQKTVFSTGFDYDELPVVIEPIDLNGAQNQVGEWSGDEFPPGQGDILVFGADIVDAVGIVPSPYGGTMMLLDRPTGDPDRPNASANSDFTGSYFADLTESIGVAGANVSFQVGTRRTGGNHNKSYDVVGRDGNGEESFRLRIGANNNNEDRLGYVANGGGTVVYDLPTTVGEDGPDDVDNIGGFNVDTGPGLGAEITNVSLLLGATGFVIDFSYPDENTSNNANAYVTELLPYNGGATELAQVEFTYEASGSNGRNSGYVIDELSVTGFDNLLLGDFNFDGAIDLVDFQVMVDNFHTGNKFDQGDLNFDASVNLEDFFEFKQLFSAPAGAAAVPEPNSLALLAGAFLLLFAGRHSRLDRKG